MFAFDKLAYTDVQSHEAFDFYEINAHPIAYINAEYLCNIH
jgi:hypothetical protein